MRTITAAQQAVIDSGSQAEYVRVWVKDQGGTFRDLTTYAGRNMIKSVVWRESIDDPHATFDIVLHREQFLLNLSPYVTASALNKAFDPTATPAALLHLNAELYIEVAIVGMDRQPSSGDWMEVFRGRIDSVDAAKGYDVEIGGRGLSGRLAQQYVKEELVYSFADVSGVAVAMRVWQPDTDYVAGQYLLPATRGDTDPGYARFFKCRTTGTSGTTEPVWSTGTNIADNTTAWDYQGAPTNAGHPVEEIIQNILDDNRGTGDPAVTLSVPVSPGWDITQFQQKRTFTLDAVRALATQIGWDLRYRWDGSAWALTLYEPDRSPGATDHDFGPAEYGEPTELAVDIADIRNVWRGIYTDPADTFPDGQPKRKHIDVRDSTSVTKYGELWAEMQEDSASQIDTSTEMTAFLTSALSDCSEPTAVVSIPTTLGFPWVELNDYYGFTPASPPRFFDSTLQLAVTGYDHTFEAGALKTQLSLRGKPTIGARAWIANQFHPELSAKMQLHRMVNFGGARTPTPVFNESVGGSHIFLAEDYDKVQLATKEYEVHVYQSSGATLDSSTLAGVTKGPMLSLPHLEPGATYYTRAVPRFFNDGRLVRGQPSKELSFVAGQAYAGHIQSGIALGDYPLNGGFETRFNAAALPDHWEMVSGTFGTDITVVEDGNGISGKRYLRLKGGAVLSAEFPFTNEDTEANRFGGVYRFSWWRKSGSDVQAGATYDIKAYLFEYDGTLDTSIDLDASKPVDDKLGHWVREEIIVSAEAGAGWGNARTISILIGGGSTTANRHIDIDEMRCQYLGSHWMLFGDTSNYTDNYESIPGFDNSYQAFSTALGPAFRRDQFGVVKLKGAFKHATTTTVGSSMGTLPVGYRPPQKRTFAIDANGKHGRLVIDTDGTITLAAADDANPSTKVSVDGVQFEVHDYT